MKIIAGFECGHLPWNGHDLLKTTLHTPETNMAEHYAIAKAHGIGWVRDGQNPNSGLFTRLILAQESGLIPIFDLLHYHEVTDSHKWGRTVGYAWQAIFGDQEFWCCPQNEPSIVPMMRQGVSVDQAVHEGKEVLRGVREVLSNVKFLHFDVPGVEDWFDADVIGLNLYPHLIDRPIRDYLKEAQDRLGKTVIISETSWHSGYHEQFFPYITNKTEWLKYIVEECEAVGVDTICWYPFVDSPPWDDPENPVRWSHGLIRKDLSVDEELGLTIREVCGRD